MAFIAFLKTSFTSKISNMSFRPKCSHICHIGQKWSVKIPNWSFGSKMGHLGQKYKLATLVVNVDKSKLDILVDTGHIDRQIQNWVIYVKET